MKGAQRRMKKKRKKMLKNIKREKERLEKNLDTFLKKLPDDEREGYEPFVNFVEVLQGLDFVKMEMNCVPISSWILMPNLKMDSMRKLNIALAILYSFIMYEVYDDRNVNVKCVPDELMNEITAFKSLLENFLFF